MSPESTVWLWVEEGTGSKKPHFFKLSDLRSDWVQSSAAGRNALLLTMHKGHEETVTVKDNTGLTRRAKQQQQNPPPKLQTLAPSTLSPSWEGGSHIKRSMKPAVEAGSCL